MPRVTLVEHPFYEHSHPMTVRATDINYAGHLGNETLLGLVHEARAHFLKALNFLTVVGSNQPVGLIIADLTVNFKAEAFAHEQIIVDSQIDEVGKKSFRLFHRVRRASQLIALIETGMVSFSYAERRIVDLPLEFTRGLEEYRNKTREIHQETEKPG